MDALSVTELMKENTRLRAELQDLNMWLSAIKVITTKITPTCASKLTELLDMCVECKLSVEDEV